MAMDSKEANLTLRIAKADGEADVEDLDQLTHTLMKNLGNMDIESVTLLYDQDYLPGAKGDPFIIGGLLIAILPAALPKVVEFLQKWALRNKDYVIRAKVQKGDRTAEIEYTAEMPPNDLRNHLETIKQLVAG